MLIRFVAQRSCFPVVDECYIFCSSASEKAVRENWPWLKGMHRSVGQDARLKVLHLRISKNKHGELSLGVDRSLGLGSGFFNLWGEG